MSRGDTECPSCHRPVTAVRGNCDVGVWAEALPVRAELELHGVRFLVGHVEEGFAKTPICAALVPSRWTWWSSGTVIRHLWSRGTG
jgi:hypothetical protein